MGRAYTFAPALPEDAWAIRRIEEETFRECPYDEEELQRLLREGRVRGPAAGRPYVWLAWAGQEPAGLVSAFVTPGLEGPRWEIDLLAVRPTYRGQGLGRQLIHTALSFVAGASAPPSAWPEPGAASHERLPSPVLARAWVEEHNIASSRAFAYAGFTAQPDTCELWTYPIRGLVPREPDPSWPLVTSQPFTADWAQGYWGLEVTAEQQARLDEILARGGILLSAGQEIPLAGVLALPVQTLHYWGFWLEGWWPKLPAGAALALLAALLASAVEAAKAQGMDEVGAMLPAQTPWRLTLPAQGYRLVARYREYTRRCCPGQKPVHEPVCHPNGPKLPTC